MSDEYINLSQDKQYFFNYITSFLDDKTFNELISFLYFNVKKDDIISSISSLTSDISKIKINIDFNDIKNLDDKIKFIKNFLKNSNFAPIKNTYTNKNEIDLNKRICKKYVFNENISNKLNDIFKNSIKNKIFEKERKIIESIEFYENFHFDLLYYEKGGKFLPHRDKSFLKTEDPNLIQYSLIICIDSNIDESSDEGNTVLYIPHHTFPYTFQNLLPQLKEEYITIDYQSNEDFFNLNCQSLFLNKHIFSESCCKRKYIIFPSEMKHSSNEIISDGNFKLILKTDFYIKFKENIPKPIYTENKCLCKLCQKDFYEKKIFFDSIKSLNIIYDLKYYISTFLFSDKINDRCDLEKECSCCECIKKQIYDFNNYGDDDDHDHYCFNDYDNHYDHYDNFFGEEESDGFCNDYDDYY